MNRPFVNRPAVEKAGIRTHVRMPLELGGTVVDADVWTFTGLIDGAEHLAIGLGNHRAATSPLVRPHSECLTGDVLGSTRCDCGPQLREALQILHEVGGYLLYLRQEGRGIGLYNKLDAYGVQDCGLDTYAANSFLGFDEDERRYDAVGQMLRALGVTSVALLTNNPAKVEQIAGSGMPVVAVRNTGYFMTPQNESYLYAKISRAGHWSGDPCSVEQLA
jgi:GTP cyclohydrolase II